MTSIPRPPVYRVVLTQFSLLAILIAILLIWQQSWLVSAIAGSLLAIIPNLYFTHYAFRYRGAKSAALIARAFTKGEVGKFILTLIGFAGVFSLIPSVMVSVLFGCYGWMLLVQWWVTARVIGGLSK